MQHEILNEDMPQMQTKCVAVTVGRFQPPHVGHYKVINKMAETIREYNLKHPNAKLETNPIVVIVTGKNTSKDSSRNPLSFDEIQNIMKASGKVDDKTIFLNAGNAFDAFKKVRLAGYEPILIFGGSDRGTDKEAPYKDMLDTYFVDSKGDKIKHKYVSIKRNDAAELDGSAQETLLKMIEKDGEVDPEIVSGSLTRKAVAMGLRNAFSSLVGLSKKKTIADIAFKKVAKGVKK